MIRTVIIVLLLPSPISAATVTYGLISRQIEIGSPAGEWELWAWTSSGDNDGLHAYGVELFGEEVEGDHTSPLRLVGETRSGGFVIGRPPIPDPNTGNLLVAAQVITPGTGGGSFRGVGSPDVPARIDPPELLPPEFEILNQEWWLNPAFVSSSMLGENPFNVPRGAAQLAVGTSGGYRSLQIFDVSSFASVFALDGFFFKKEVADTLILVDHVHVVPEPSALFTCLIVIGGLKMRHPKRYDSYS